MSDALENTEEIEIPEINMIVEDGTFVPGANSYVTIEEAIEYQTAHNRKQWLELDEETQKSSLIKGTQYVDALYIWKGRRKFKDQELNFPRVMLTDLDGFPVTGIPKKIKQAVFEAAYYGSKAELFSVYDETGVIKRDKKRVEGAVETEVEYFSNSETAVDFISKYAALDNLLRGLYVPKEWKGSINTRVHWQG